MTATITLLTVLFSVSLWIKRDAFHPAVIVSALWLLLIILYLTLNHPLYDLSSKFYQAINLWVGSFVLCSLLVGNPKNRGNDNKTSVNILFYDKCCKFFWIYSILLFALMNWYFGGLFGGSLRRFISEESYLPPIIKVFFYLNTAQYAFVLYGLMHITEIGKRKVFTQLVLLFLIAFVKANKTSFLAIFVSLLYILKRRNKLTGKTLLFVLIVIAALLCLVSVNRADYNFESNDGVTNYLYIYLLSPLTAFDGLINGEISLQHGTWGSGTLAFLYKIFNAFGAGFEIADLGEWVNVPLPTNVYTVMRGFYLDGGMLGIFVMGCVLGIIWGYLYKLQKENWDSFWGLFYSLMVSSLCFQSFGDYFFYTFSTTLQYLLFSYIMYRGIVLHKHRTTYPFPSNINI